MIALFWKALGFLKMIPWQVWAILGAAMSFWLWLGAHDAALTKKVTLDRDAYWQGREKAANDRYAADMNRKRAEVADLVLAGIALRDQLEGVIRAQAAAFDARFTELKNRRAAYVTPLANRACTLTRGVVLQFNAGAAGANGAPEPFASRAANPGTEFVDAPAGVSLDTLTGAIEDTQRALGTCRRQVTGWQSFYSTVLVPWHASLAKTLQGTPP